jgi:hypothetical protein
MTNRACFIIGGRTDLPQPATAAQMPTFPRRMIVPGLLLEGHAVWAHSDTAGRHPES